jgi:hypothetical protein
MFTVAKARKIDNYELRIDTIYISKHIGSTVKKYKNLIIEVNNSDYHLEISFDKDINDILSIKKYDKMELGKNDVIEAIFTDAKNKKRFVIITNIVIDMFNDAVGISLDFNSEQEYYGSVEVEIKLDTLKELAADK